MLLFFTVMTFIVLRTSLDLIIIVSSYALYKALKEKSPSLKEIIGKPFLLFILLFSIKAPLMLGLTKYSERNVAGENNFLTPGELKQVHYLGSYATLGAPLWGPYYYIKVLYRKNYIDDFTRMGHVNYYQERCFSEHPWKVHHCSEYIQYLLTSRLSTLEKNKLYDEFRDHSPQVYCKTIDKVYIDKKGEIIIDAHQEREPYFSDRYNFYFKERYSNLKKVGCKKAELLKLEYLGVTLSPKIEDQLINVCEMNDKLCDNAHDILWNKVGIPQEMRHNEAFPRLCLIRPASRFCR